MLENIIICFLSITFASIKSGILYVEAFIKFFRLLNILLLSVVVAILSDNLLDNVDALLADIIKFGTVSGIIGIALFFFQSPLYRPPQTFLLNNKLLYRAGGVFAEPLTFAFMMAIVFSTALRCVVNRKYIVNASIAVIVSCISIVFSDSRTGIIAIVIIVIRVFLPRKLVSKRYVLISSIVIFVITAAFIKNDHMRNSFSRVVSSLDQIATANFFNADRALSGRLSVWLNRLQDYSKSSFIQLFFGRGYKVNFAISDNNFISALYYTGLLGLIAFIAYIITLIKTAFGKYFGVESSVASEIYKDLVIISLICMFSSDAMTMSRPMYLISVLSVIIIYGRTKIDKEGSNFV